MQRRQWLKGAAALSFAGIPSAWANEAANAPRLLVVLLRGGMDGPVAF